MQAFFRREFKTVDDTVRVEQYYMSGKKLFVGQVAKNYGGADSLPFIGTCTWYYKNGKVRVVKPYDGQSKLEGWVKKYTPEGRLESEIEYRGGERVTSEYSKIDSEGNSNIVFVDEFDDNKNDWDLYSSELGSASLEDGFMILESESARGASRYIYKPIESNHFKIDVEFSGDVKKEAPVIGVLFNFINWNNYSYYTLQGRYFSIGHVEDGSNEASMELYGSVSVNVGGENLMRIKGEGREIHYYINGTLVFKEEDIDMKGNYVGMVVGGEGSTKIDRLEIGIQESSPDALEDDEIDGTGTAFMISNEGYLITNSHVIEDEEFIYVEFTQGPLAELGQLKTEVKIDDDNSDLALLQVTDTRFPKLDVIPYKVDLSPVEVGMSVYSLGYPLVLSGMGSEIKFADGRISSRTGYDNSINSYQTTVPLQPGNSGSPLFNDKGNVVGCMNAIIREADNVSYAIKASYILNLLQTAGVDQNGESNIQIENLTLEQQIKMLSQYVAIVKTAK